MWAIRAERAKRSWLFRLERGFTWHEYVMNLNLLSKPMEHLSIVPSLRVQKEDWDAQANGFETLGTDPPSPFSGNGDRGVLDVRERLDI